MASRFRIWRRLLQMTVNRHQIRISTFQRTPPNAVVIPCTLGFSILTLIGLDKKLNPEDELILTIKHCVLFIQKKQFDKAEKLLHVALRQAQLMDHQSGITYIYDLMANLALEQEQYDKAKKLFVAVSQRIMSNGVSENDPKVIHLSLKLARISHMQKEYSTAQLGFDWCLEKLHSVMKENPTEDLKTMVVQTEDWYGRLFLECNKIELGLQYLERAYNHMKELPNIEAEDLAMQLNDIGAAYDGLNNHTLSVKCFLEAIQIAKTCPEMKHLGVIYINLGRAYMKQQLIDEARKSCGYGWKLGFLSKNEEIKQEADLCIKEIKNLS